HLRGVRGAADAGDAPRPRVQPPVAAGGGVGRLRLPRAAHDRRAHPPSAREARGRPGRSVVHPDGARSGLPLPRHRAGSLRAVRSLRLRLILVLAAVVATAMGVVFLYVVPTLRATLTAGRLKRLEQVSHAEQERDSTLRGEIAHLSDTGLLPPGTHKTVRRIGRLANARVAVFQRTGGVVQDTPVNRNGLAGVTKADPIVLRAARTGFASGHRGAPLVVGFTGGDVGLVALSQQVSDVNQTADLVERRILIAAALALLVAMLVVWASGPARTRRLSHLEQGARRIALGEFDRPIGDQSPDELGQLG